MPVSLPQVPRFIHREVGLNATLHEADHGRLIAVFSRLGAESILEFLGLGTVELAPATKSLLEEAFAKSEASAAPVPGPALEGMANLLQAYKHQKPSNASDYLSQFTVSAGRHLFTGHVIAVRQSAIREDSEGEGDLVASTALRFRELTEWGETSPAFVLANELDLPLATVHSRIRLAKERGLIAKPGGPVRRQRKNV